MSGKGNGKDESGDDVQKELEKLAEQIKKVIEGPDK